MHTRVRITRGNRIEAREHGRANGRYPWVEVANDVDSEIHLEDAVEVVWANQ